MVRGARLPFPRVGVAILWIVAAIAPASCAKVWGIDDGLPYPDASTDGTPAADGPTQDTAVEAAIDSGEDVHDAGTSETAPEDGGACDGGSYCTSHCGGTDPCGQGCSDNCSTSPGWSCDPTSHQCVCQHDPSWCNNRCGTITDNCGQPYDCPCDGGNCVADANPCETQICGSTTDSCDDPVNCGNSGACSNGGICQNGGTTCCLPNPNPCPGHCNTAPNGCGSNVTCPATCPNGEACNEGTNTCYCPPPTCTGNVCGTVMAPCGASQQCSCSSGECVGTTCCQPQGCSTTNNCEDTCGVFQSACCHDSGPTCIGSSQPCGSGPPCCPGLSCQAGECAPIPTDGGNGEGGPCAGFGQDCSALPCCSGSCEATVEPEGGGVLTCQ